ncbi:MAG TPA: protoporphyrinogen oxidase [Acidimicrobiales bacterium]|nr:protoporphyrinogen oxidase [Acidimicrobiales bacterium]
MTRPHVAVVGGGIAGLAAALDLMSDADVTVLESGRRLGGAIDTVEFAGSDVDTGPDSFLARRPEMIELATRLGLADDLVAPATGAAAVWLRSGLRPLPAGLVLGVPSSLTALAASGILSAAGLGRAALDYVLPSTAVGEDIGVGDLVRQRLGPEVHERLVDPLLGGIHAGRSEHLSAAVGAPQLLAAARGQRSLLRSLGASAPPASPTTPVFLTVRGGLGRVVRAAQDALAAGAGSVRLSTEVIELATAAAGRGVTLGLAAGGTLDVDGVVLATPAPTTTRLLASVAPAAATRLNEVRYASVVLTLLAYPSDALPSPFTMSGFLVPRTEGRLLTAASWSSSKWAHLGGSGTEIVRASCGRIDDERALEMDDATIVGSVHTELAEATGIRSEPHETRVVRWRRALPQFEVGHALRAARAHAVLESEAPGVVLAGAAYEGLGLPACVASGRRAAATLLKQLLASD